MSKKNNNDNKIKGLSFKNHTKVGFIPHNNRLARVKSSKSLHSLEKVFPLTRILTIFIPIFLANLPAQMDSPAWKHKR
jgi:hypothetical protein